MTRMGFRARLRAGATDNDLIAAIHRTLDLQSERHEFREQPEKTRPFDGHDGG